MLKFLLLCFLSWEIATYSEADIAQFISENLGEFCPHSFCQNPVRESINDEGRRSCCSPCTCDETCSLLGNCCPDKDEISDEETELPCKDTNIKRDPFARFIAKKYRIVDECPQTEGNVELAQNCSSTNITSYESMIWVSETNTGRIYQNRFCAACHGIENYVYWHVELTECPDAFNDGYTLDIDMILKDCPRITLEAQDTIAETVKKYQCFRPEYSTCNKTGLWKVYNETIDNACLSFSMPYFKTGHKHSGQIPMIFNNVFCYICNFNNHFESIPKVCPDIDVLFERSRKMSFSILVDFKSYLNGEDASQKGSCEVNEIFDPYLNICQQLYCPLGSRPFKGTCEKVFSQMLGLAIQAVYQLKVLWHKTALNLHSLGEHTDERPEKEIGLAVYNEVKTLLNFDDKKCPICLEHLQMFPKNESLLHGGYLMVSRRSSTADCQPDTIFMKMLGVIGKTFTVRKRKYGYITLEIVLQKEPYTYFDIHYTIAYYQSLATCVLNFQIKSEKTCPNIELNYTKVLKMPGSRARSSAVSLFKPEEPNVIELCIEEYFAFMSKNGQMSCKWSQTISTHICLMGFLILINWTSPFFI